MSAPAGRAIPARRPAALLAVLALAALGAGRLGAPDELRRALAAPVLLGGAAFPLLVALSPPEPSALKLGLLSWLAGPWVLAALFGLARLALPPAAALELVLLAGAALQLLAARRVLRFDPPGRAAWTALGLGVLLGAGILGLHLAAPALRLMGDGPWHAGWIEALDRGALPDDPWLAGRAGRHPFAYHLLGELAQRALRLAPTAAPAWLAAWAAGSLPVSLYFLAAPFWAEPRRVLAGVLGGLAGWNAAGGLLWLARGLPFAVPRDAGRWLVGFERALPAGEPGLPLYGPAPYLLPGPFPAALALAAGAWMCAAHALRHAGRPWVGLCALLHGLASLLDPGLGAAAAAATAGAALSKPGTRLVRPKVLLALAVCQLPALVASRHLAGAGPVLGELAAPGPATAACGAAGLALLALAGLPWRAGGEAPGRASIGTLLVLGSLLPAALALAFVPAGALPGGALALSGLALGVLAGGAVAALGRGGLRRVATGLLGALVGVGAVASWTLVARGQLALAELPVLAERPLAVAPLEREPPTTLDADAARLWRWLREELPADLRGAVLIPSERREPDRLPFAPRPHPGPLFAGLDLWADRSEPGARARPETAVRVRLARELFEGGGHAGVGLVHAIGRLGRPAILWVGEADRRAAKGLEAGLGRIGFEPLHRSGAQVLYLWRPPAAQGGPPELR